MIEYNGEEGELGILKIGKVTATILLVPASAFSRENIQLEVIPLTDENYFILMDEQFALDAIEIAGGQSDAADLLIEGAASYFTTYLNHEG